MATLGELVIQIGVLGDVKPLEKALSTMKETTSEMERQYKAAQRLKKYLLDLKKAKTAEDKADIKKGFEIAIRKDNEMKLAKQIKEQKQLRTNIENTAKKFAGFALAIIGAGVALNKLTNSLVESNQAFLNLTRTSDIALSTFQKWDNVGRMFGVKNAAQQIENLNQRLFELRLTGEGSRGFLLAGVNPMGTNAEGVLEQLRNRVQGMDNTSATYLLQQMGLDPQMLHLLKMTRDEFEAYQQTVSRYRLTEDQTKQIQRMNAQLEIAKIKLQYLRDRVVLAIMPAWTAFMQSLARVTEGLARFGKWLVSTKTGLATVTASILLTTKAIWGGLIPAIRALFALLAAHPVIAGITAALGALYLLVDDIMAYFTGGESMIGLILGFFDELDSKMNSSQSPQWLKDLLALVGSLDKLDKLSNTIKKIKNNESVTASSLDVYKNILRMAAPMQGGAVVAGMLNLLTPTTHSSSSTNYDNRQNSVVQNIDIHTSQPAMDIQKELTFANATLGYGY